MAFLTRCLFILALLVPGHRAEAQDPLGFGDVALGARVLASRSIYAGGAHTAAPLPNLGFNANAFTVGVEGIRLRLYSYEGHRLDAILRPRFAPYAASDSPQLAGMDRDFTADIGLRYAISYPNDVQVSLIALTEATQEHGGHEVELRVSHGFQVAGVPLAAYVGAAWRSDDLSAFLYGVRPSEAMVGRAAYDPGDTVTPFIGLSTLVPLTARLSLTAGLRMEVLPADIRQSPIVSEHYGVSGTLGGLWRF